MAHLGKCFFPSLLRFDLYTYDGRVRGCWCNVLLFVFSDVQVVSDESAFTRLRTEFLISGTQSPRDDLGSV